jgi:hypothetical protein
MANPTNPLADLFGGKEEKETRKESTLENTIPSILFKAQIDAKITHLLQKDKTLAKHNALGMFYDEVGDKIDTFVETYMGIYPIEEICTEESCCIKEPLTYFKNLYLQIEKLRKSIKETFLQNQIDEVQQLISHTIYRLTYIVT